MLPRRFLVTVTSATLLVSLLAIPAAGQSPAEQQAEAEFLTLINTHRANAGLAPLAVHADLVDDARAHSAFQASDGCADGWRICHNPALGSVTTGWEALGENVGVGWNVAGLDAAFWKSPGHKANVVGNYTHAGVGVVIRDDESMYVTVVFMRASASEPAPAPVAAPPNEPPAAAPAPEAAPTAIDTSRDVGSEFPDRADRVGQHDPQRGSWSLDGADFYFGVPLDVAVTCDWDADGGSSVGLYRPSSGFVHVRNTNTFGTADAEFFYGIREDLPVCGDWNGDGTETIGVYRPSQSRFYLRNSNTMGFADIEFDFGRPGDVPLAGDWYGSGHDSVGLYRPSDGILYLADGKERLGNVVALPRWDVASGDQLVVGDWDADGADTVGFYRPSERAFHLPMTHEPDAEAMLVPFGSAGLMPVAGRWS